MAPEVPPPAQTQTHFMLIAFLGRQRTNITYVNKSVKKKFFKKGGGVDQLVLVHNTFFKSQ